MNKSTKCTLYFMPNCPIAKNLLNIYRFVSFNICSSGTIFCVIVSLCACECYEILFFCFSSSLWKGCKIYFSLIFVTKKEFRESEINETDWVEYQLNQGTVHIHTYTHGTKTQLSCSKQGEWYFDNISWVQNKVVIRLKIRYFLFYMIVKNKRARFVWNIFFDKTFSFCSSFLINYGYRWFEHHKFTLTLSHTKLST